MSRFRISLLLILAACMFTNCSNYRSITRKNKTMPPEEMASHIKKGKYYRILLTDGNTAHIRVKKIEGTTIYGNVRTVDKKYYPLRDSAGNKIGSRPGSVNLKDAVSLQKRKPVGVAVAVPLAFGIAFVWLLASSGPWLSE